MSRAEKSRAMVSAPITTEIVRKRGKVRSGGPGWNAAIRAAF
jgi:hypothetical protein